MKTILALILAISFGLTGCGTNQVQEPVPQATNTASIASEEKALDSSPNSRQTADADSTVEVDSEVFIETSEPSASASDDSTAEQTGSELSALYQDIEDQEIADENLDLSDEKLQQYIEDRIYQEAINNFDNDNYLVDNIQTIYYSKEYIEQLSYNSQENIYFGFTQSQLNQQFQGKKYVFTLGDNGETTVIEVKTYEDNTAEEVLKNVAIGSGVLLVCVTVSVATGGVAPAVSMIFTVGAKTGAAAALSGGVIGGVSAGILKGYQTGNFSDAMSAAALGASEGFKWGAITGALSGGASETWGLLDASKHGAGLTMNEVAAIQKDSKYPLDVIKQFHSMDEYNIYKNAGLKTQMIDGKLALVQDIDWNHKSIRPDGSEVTNRWLVEHNHSPVDANDVPYDLHHVNQDADGTLAILSKSEHTSKDVYSILHRRTTDGVHNPESGLTAAEWKKIRDAFWKDYLKQCLEAGGSV